MHPVYIGRTFITPEAVSLIMRGKSEYIYSLQNVYARVCTCVGVFVPTPDHTYILIPGNHRRKFTMLLDAAQPGVWRTVVDR